MDIHKKIEQARVSAGLTQDEMADKLGIKRSTYQYWEKKTPSISKIKLVETVLNLPSGFFTDEKIGNDEKIIGSDLDPIVIYKEKYMALLEEIAEERKEKKSSITDHLIKIEERQEALMKFVESNLQSLSRGQKLISERLGRIEDFLQAIDLSAGSIQGGGDDEDKSNAPFGAQVKDLAPRKNKQNK